MELVPPGMLVNKVQGCLVLPSVVNLAPFRDASLETSNVFSNIPNDFRGTDLRLQSELEYLDNSFNPVANTRGP